MNDYKAGVSLVKNIHHNEPLAAGRSISNQASGDRLDPTSLSLKTFQRLVQLVKAMKYIASNFRLTPGTKPFLIW